MILAILVMITALSISAVAIYYSVSGLVAIFAAAAIPIIIMGSVLEIGKLVTAVWLHWYWRKAAWWLKTYLSIAVLVLMFITSMGIFGFLSKAHIEQTAAADEGIAQIARIDDELGRLDFVIQRAEERIVEAEASVGLGNAAIQAQIDKEQERIDTAYDRIQPAIDEQNTIIQNARENDKDRTKPFEEQLVSIQDEVVRLESSARDYENTIAGLKTDTSAVEPIAAQIQTIQDQISKVEGQIASGEREQIRQAQTTIGANADGSAGPNTRRAANAWIENQRAQIQDLNAKIAQLQQQAIDTVKTERSRLSAIINDIRNNQIPALKQREVEMLAKIEDVRAAESPIVIRARDEITRIRASADQQIAASNNLIQQLRNSLTVGKDPQVEAVVVEQTQRIIEANNSIDKLTQDKYTLQAEYRKLEAEVGPVKYLAEFIYDDAGKDVLEEAVRWVIIVIIFVFDPLAVLLLIASQATFEMRRREYPRLGSKEQINDIESNDNQHVEHASTTHDSTGSNETSFATQSGSGETKSIDAVAEMYSNVGTTGNGGITSSRLSESQQEARRLDLEAKEDEESYKEAKRKWKLENPDQHIKDIKEQYILGERNDLPWAKDLTGYIMKDKQGDQVKISYVQNEEQKENSIWQSIKDDKDQLNNTTG